MDWLRLREVSGGSIVMKGTAVLSLVWATKEIVAQQIQHVAQQMPCLSIGVIKCKMPTNTENNSAAL